MRLSTAIKFLILAHAACNVPSVLCNKGSMGDDTATATATTVDGNDNHNNERLLASLSSKDYYYRRNYITIIESDNFVLLFPNGGSIGDDIPGYLTRGVPQFQGSSTIFNGKVYDPADIAIVNRFDGLELNDIPDEKLALGTRLIGFPFSGNRQPKQPIPPGDSAFFYHGYCGANSANTDILDSTGIVASHSCKLNICLGGGGFDCIAFYSGTSFVFELRADNDLPPPFPATIIGGTGSFEGIEGTVDIATICGTTSPKLIFLTPNFFFVKIGFIVQTISINANMPLPIAP